MRFFGWLRSVRTSSSTISAGRLEGVRGGDRRGIRHRGDRAAGSTRARNRGRRDGQGPGRAQFERALAEYGRLDILVNNAGGQLRRSRQPCIDLLRGDHRFILDVNLNATVFLLPGSGGADEAQRAGKIVNVSSQAGLRGNVSGNDASYCMAKAAIVEYTHCSPRVFGPYNINVTASRRG